MKAAKQNGHQATGVAAILIASALFLSGSVVYAFSRKQKNISKGRINRVLFVGDSQTVPAWSYANILGNYLSLNYTKIARNGMPTSAMLNDLLLHDLSEYDTVVVFGGGNDISAGRLNVAMSNLNSIYSHVKNSGKRLIAIAPPSKELSPIHSDLQKQQNLQLRDFVLNHSLPDAKINATELNDGRYFLSDKIHLNRTGHEALAKMFISILKK